mmetsp:Transcript_11776/g.23697  ORF Transcript_11776/g.23697 Transcript_11776/m.23697 type:complete len:1085 (-) Transcript_11776:816-4070(-)
MLLGLPEDRFGNIIEYIFQNEDMTFAQASSRIQSHIDRTSTSSDAKDSLNNMTSNRRQPQEDRKMNGRDPNWKSKIKCHHCGILGHLKRECRKLKKLQARQRQQNEKDKNKDRDRRSNDKNNNMNEWDDLWTLSENVSPQPSSNVALIDNGCTRHVTNRKDIFITFRPETRQRGMTGLGGSKVSQGTGTVKLQTQFGILTIHDVAYIPDVKGTFIAERRLKTQDGYSLSTDHEHGIITVRDKAGKIIVKSDPKIHEVLHFFRFKSVRKVHQDSLHAMNNTDALKKLHLGLCHQSTRVLQHTAQAVDGLPDIKFPAPKSTDPPCDACLTTKAKRRHFGQKKIPQEDHKTRDGITIHLDLKTCLRQSAAGHRHYLVVVTQDERFTAAKPLRSKHCFDEHTSFVKSIERQTGRKVLRFKSDCGGEFMNTRIRDWNRRHGIEAHYCPPYTPETNGLAERHVQWFHNAIQTIIKHSKMPQNFWHWALRYAVWVRNRLVNASNIEKTPYELLLKKKPSLKHLHPFGCIGYLTIPKARRQRGGFGDKGQRCRMLGYDKEDNWFWVLTPNRKIIKTTNVRFFDLQFQFPKAPSPDDTKVPPIEHLDASGGDDNKNNDEAQEFKTPEQDQKHSQDSTARRLTQDFHRDEAQDSKTPSSTTRNLIDDFDQEDDADDDDEDSINDDEDSKHDEKTTQDSKKEAPRSSLNNLRKPEGSWSSQSYKEAKEQGRWEKPMEEEISALERNKTWTIVRKQPAMNIITCRWTYKEKTDRSGVIYRLKARLVARGFQQRGISLDAKFSPTVRLESVRLVIAKAISEGWILTTCDINNAFLHGFLQEPVYMQIPLGMRDRYDHRKYCCKLNKGLYGLQVSARAWNEEFNNFVTGLGFKRSVSDPCVYTLKHEHGEMILCVYVDDLIICSSNEDELSKNIVKKIEDKYGIKEHKELDFVLGIEVLQRKDHILLSQKAYIQRLLKKHNMEDCNGVRTPMSPSQKLTRNPDGEPADETTYRSIIGGLAFVMTCTRPDIAFAVSKLSRYLNAPTKDHMQAALHLLRYLKHTMEFCFLPRFATLRSATLGKITSAYACWGLTVLLRRS